ncbi:MAG: anti-sigma factor [Bryobacteraceae bacterium]
MTCDHVCDNLELYALGALDGPESLEVGAHLATGCATCNQALGQALRLSLAISQTAPKIEPPARLRRRVKEAISPAGALSRRWLPWALAFATALLAIVVILTQIRLHRQSEIFQAQLADRTRLLDALQIISARGTREVLFADAKVPQIHGAVYIHDNLGLALVIDHLPEAPVGWKYESWIVPRSGDPRPVESFRRENDGHAVSLMTSPIPLADVAALAVSIEPQDSNPTKPTKVVFAAKI